MVVARIVWLRDRVAAGVACGCDLGAARDPAKCKLKVVLKPGGVATSATTRDMVLRMLDLVSTLVVDHIAVDRGHRFSDGRVEACFWFRQAGPFPGGPPGAADDDDGNGPPDPAGDRDPRERGPRRRERSPSPPGPPARPDPWHEQGGSDPWSGGPYRGPKAPRAVRYGHPAAEAVPPGGAVDCGRLHVPGLWSWPAGVPALWAPLNEVPALLRLPGSPYGVDVDAGLRREQLPQVPGFPSLLAASAGARVAGHRMVRHCATGYIEKLTARSTAASEFRHVQAFVYRRVASCSSTAKGRRNSRSRHPSLLAGSADLVGHLGLHAIFPD